MSSHLQHSESAILGYTPIPIHSLNSSSPSTLIHAWWI